MSLQYQMFIDGEFCQAKSGKKQKVINPANGEIIAEVPRADADDIKSAINAARQAFDNGPWKDLSFQERKDYLLKISSGILDKAGELAQLETKNNGKPIKESTFMDIPSSAATFEYFANDFQQYLKSENIKLPVEAESSVRPEPRGVVVLIVPWNYPLLIASWKMAQALAAGNTIVLKPSSLTPLTVLELAKIIKQVGLPKGVVNIISGSGAEIGNTLCSDEKVDMISFTGSNSVGKEIMRTAASSAKKLIMELGGKSASMVFADCDLDVAVNSCLSSIFLNQGQMCTAMSRILVQDSVYEKFLEKFVERTKRIKLGDGLDPETQMGPLVSQEQRKKIVSYVKKALAEGAKVLCGGRIPEKPEFKKGFFFEPTVFSEVKPDMNIFQEEIFGPVVCISKFSSEQEAVELANNSYFGLAASIWTKDLEKAKVLSNKINAGTIWINTYGMFYNQAPYGGFKQSGFGKELGKEGFLEYTRLKHINLDLSKDSRPLVSYWYGF